MANFYKTSTGEKFTTLQIETKMRVAKAKALENQFDEYQYNFCEQCGRNSSGTRLDCSHFVPVKKAKENGMSELCFETNNINILCRECHKKRDGLNLQF